MVCYEELDKLEIDVYEMGRGLTLIFDNNAQCFEDACCILRPGWDDLKLRDCLSSDDRYDAWWEAVRRFIVETPREVLAMLAEDYTGRTIDL